MNEGRKPKNKDIILARNRDLVINKSNLVERGLQLLSECMGPEKLPSILFVDDESAIVDTLQEYFVGKGFKTFKALSAEEAIPILQENYIDVVLTDDIMPGMSGFEFTKIIKKEYDSDVIILCGYYDKNGTDEYEEAIKLGASDLCLKPCTLKDMLLRVKRVLIERNKNHLDLL